MSEDASIESEPSTSTAISVSRPPARRFTMIGAGLTLLIVGINMRPAIVALSPLLGQVQAATRISSSAAGALYALPILCFGIFAPLAPRLIRRFGMEATLLAVLLVLLMGVAVRLWPALAALFGGTFLIGLAVAIANVAVTALIKRDFPGQIGLMSGLHTTMLLGGGALAAGLTLPIRDALGLSWPQALAMWGILALIALIIWLPKIRRNRHVRTAESGIPTSLVWTSPIAWSVALFYAFQSVIYYTVTSWLPTFYDHHGESAGYSGWLLSFCLILAIVSAVATPIIAQRSARQSYLAILGSAFCAIALVGFILAPTTGELLWVGLMGVGLGAVVSLGIQFMSTRAGGPHEAAMLSAMSQCVGYLIALFGPILFGFAFDASGGWNIGLIGVLVAVIPMAWAGFLAGRGGEIAHHLTEAAATS